MNACVLKAAGVSPSGQETASLNLALQFATLPLPQLLPSPGSGLGLPGTWVYPVGAAGRALE